MVGISLILKMMKLKEFRYCDDGHTPRGWQSWDVNQSLSDCSAGNLPLCYLELGAPAAGIQRPPQILPVCAWPGQPPRPAPLSLFQRKAENLLKGKCQGLVIT